MAKEFSRNTEWAHLPEFGCFVRYSDGVLMSAPELTNGKRDTSEEAICEVNIPHMEAEEPDFMPAVYNLSAVWAFDMAFKN